MSPYLSLVVSYQHHDGTWAIDRLTFASPRALVQHLQRSAPWLAELTIIDVAERP